MSHRLLNASLCESWLLVVSLAGACVSASDPVGSDESSRDAGAAERACARGERPVMGSRVDTGSACIGAPSVLGCIADERACDDAETVVRGRDGVQWWLADLCIPDGYSALATDEARKILSYPRCGEASGSGAPATSECGSSGRQSCPVGECPHEASRLDEARGCWKKSEMVGCTPAGSSCPPVILYMRDAQGARWQFPSGCPLPGFTRVAESEVAQLISLQHCDPPMTTPPACDALSVETCDAGTRCKVARGIQYDPMRRCRWPGFAQVACVEFSMGCSTAITHASYADQRMPSFQFNDSCIPPKYVSLPGSELVDDWPICPEAQK